MEKGGEEADVSTPEPEVDRALQSLLLSSDPAPSTERLKQWAGVLHPGNDGVKQLPERTFYSFQDYSPVELAEIAAQAVAALLPSRMEFFGVGTGDAGPTANGQHLPATLTVTTRRPRAVKKTGPQKSVDHTKAAAAEQESTEQPRLHYFPPEAVNEIREYRMRRIQGVTFADDDGIRGGRLVSEAEQKVLDEDEHELEKAWSEVVGAVWAVTRDMEVMAGEGAALAEEGVAAKKRVYQWLRLGDPPDYSSVTGTRGISEMDLVEIEAALHFFRGLRQDICEFVDGGLLGLFAKQDSGSDEESEEFIAKWGINGLNAAPEKTKKKGRNRSAQQQDQKSSGMPDKCSVAFDTMVIKAREMQLQRVHDEENGLFVGVGGWTKWTKGVCCQSEDSVADGEAVPKV